MNYHLVARPIQIPDESPAGVLIRAVEGNGYPNLQALIWAYWRNASGKGWAKAAHTNPKRFKQIMDAFGISITDEQSSCFKRSGPTSESARILDGQVYPEKMFRDDARYYCPKCLQQHAYWRKQWALRPFSVCPEHKVFLLCDCPVCGAALRPWRGKLTKCECGANLAEMSSEPANPSTLDWWLNYHSRSTENAHLVDSLFLAISEIDGGATDPHAEFLRLSAVRSWIETANIDQQLLGRVKQHSDKVHPRIQLLPLLGSRLPELNSMAKTILIEFGLISSVETEVEEEWMSCNDARLSLGISNAHFKHFMKHHLLDFSDGRERRRGQVSRFAVNRLLSVLQADSKVAVAKEGRSPTCSLAEMVVDILSGNRKGAGYDIAEGLATLQFGQQSGCLREEGFSKEWLDVNQMADLLGTYPEAVRFICRMGWIASRGRDMQERKRLIATRESVEGFNQKYVLAGTFALQVKENPTNLAEKLMALGVAAVAGPKIDGTLVYFFNRRDIENVDLNALRKLRRYKTNAGRKAKAKIDSTVQNEEGTLTAVQVAEMLNIRVQDVHILIRKKFLQNANRLDRAIHVTKQSLVDFQQMISRPDMISVENAASRLKLSPRSMQSLWINSGVLNIYDLGLWRRIVVQDLEKLEQLLAQNVTAAEAGRILSMHRSYLPNLERRGLIKSVRVGSKKQIRLYARSDMEKLLVRERIPQ